MFTSPKARKRQCPGAGLGEERTESEESRSGSESIDNEVNIMVASFGDEEVSDKEWLPEERSETEESRSGSESTDDEADITDSLPDEMGVSDKEFLGKKRSEPEESGNKSTDCEADIIDDTPTEHEVLDNTLAIRTISCVSMPADSNLFAGDFPAAPGHIELNIRGAHASLLDKIVSSPDVPKVILHRVRVESSKNEDKESQSGSADNKDDEEEEDIPVEKQNLLDSFTIVEADWNRTDSCMSSSDEIRFNNPIDAEMSDSNVRKTSTQVVAGVAHASSVEQIISTPAPQNSMGCNPQDELSDVFGNVSPVESNTLMINPSDAILPDDF